MKKNLITPAQHGMIDYGFSGIQLLAPAAIGLNPKAVKIYKVLGAGFLAVNAFSDTPVGLKRIIPFNKSHKKADEAFLATLSLLTFTKRICKHRKTLAFHLGFLSVAIAHYALTDYKARPKR